MLPGGDGPHRASRWPVRHRHARSRAEDGAFRGHLQAHTPLWTEAARRGGARQGEPDQNYSTTPAPQPSAEGYRIVWVHSTAKANRAARARAAPIDALDAKLAGPRCRFKTRVAVEQAAADALTDAHAGRWVTATVTQTTTTTTTSKHALTDRTQDQLPRGLHHPLHRAARHRSGQDPLRRRQRRMLPAD